MTRLVDLTLTLRPGMPGVAVEPARTLERDGWNASTFSLYSHCGTHMDAPLHFGVSDETIDQLDVTRCVGLAWVADLTPIEPRALIDVQNLGDIATRLQPGESLLLRTDWSRRVGDASWRDELPRVSEALAHWCVRYGVRMLGVEPPSVADVNNLEEVTRIHRILLGGGVTIIEGLSGLDRLRSRRVRLIALPLKIAGADGAPARVVAEDVPQ
jgi:arylformamidase